MSARLDLDLDELAYHAHPALSQSGAKLLLDCPARFRWEMDNRTERDAFDIGHAVHAKVLGEGAPIAVIPATGRTKAEQTAHREAKEAARAEGKTPVTAEQAADVDRLAESVLAHDEARALLEVDGRSEVSMFWDEETTLGWDNATVSCRGRIDRLTEHNGAPLAVDLKTTGKSSAPIPWRSAVLDYGYDVQAAAYGRGYHAITGDPLPMAHIVVEKTRPHVVAVYGPMPPEYVERGERRWLDAVRVYAECTRTNTWPARPGLTEYPPLPARAS